MEDHRSEQIAEIRNQIALLQSNEKRLQVLIRSKFPSEQYKIKARADLNGVLETLKELQGKFVRLVAKQ